MEEGATTARLALWIHPAGCLGSGNRLAMHLPFLEGSATNAAEPVLWDQPSSCLGSGNEFANGLT